MLRGAVEFAIRFFGSTESRPPIRDLPSRDLSKKIRRCVRSENFWLFSVQLSFSSASRFGVDLPRNGWGVCLETSGSSASTPPFIFPSSPASSSAFCSVLSCRSFVGDHFAKWPPHRALRLVWTNMSLISCNAGAVHACNQRPFPAAHS